jgi:hypothetical protein
MRGYIRGKLWDKQEFSLYPHAYCGELRIPYPNHRGRVIILCLGLRGEVAIPTSCCFFLVTTTKPSTAQSEDPVPLFAALGAMCLLRRATIDMEPPAFLVLLTVCPCCTSWFLNTMSLYDIVPDGEGSDSSAISLLWSQHASKKTVHILTRFWVQANGARALSLSRSARPTIFGNLKGYKM